MAVIYNNQVCVFANELIAYNKKSGVGTDSGFLPEGTYYSKVTRGLIMIARRSTPKSSALVYFDTMEEYIKQQYIKIYGDPHEAFDALPKQSLLERELEYNEEAYSFFTEYTDCGGKKLKPEKASLYTLQARILEAVLRLWHENRIRIGSGQMRVNVWDTLSRMVNDLLEQLENSPLPPRLLHLIIPAEAILDHAESVQKLRLAGCRIVLSQVGRDLQIFNSLKANMADYLLLDGELCANVQGNLMDEMLITIIQGHAQRLGMKTIAGPVVLPLVMDTLSGIGVDLIYGDVIADAQPLDLLVNSSYFAIN